MESGRTGKRKMTHALKQDGIRPSPFDPDREDLYKTWRDRKMEGYPTSPGELVVESGDPR